MKDGLLSIASDLAASAKVVFADNFHRQGEHKAKPSIALAELAEKGADTDIVRDLLGYIAQRLMDLDVEGRCGAGYCERTGERANSRNGYRERLWETRAGSIDLKIPKLRRGSYFPASSSLGGRPRKRWSR